MPDYDFKRIVTHNDFDGIVSGAICSLVSGCDHFVFTGPNSIARAEVSVGPSDVVTDLPYPLDCGMWFDHHPGNLDAVKLTIDGSIVTHYLYTEREIREAGSHEHETLDHQ